MRRYAPKWPGLTLAALLPVIHGAALAQDAAPGQRIVVTGSNLHRADAETPSPVQTLSAADLKDSGYTNLADVLHQITANNMGSLSQASPGAFAAGGSGIALRGLTVGATLVLIDGHRMAAYPMPDDGERDFVDISSIPLDAIERVEVLKDGASAVYGSDAMAGVVNVILKKTITATTIGAELGSSTKRDGRTAHFSFSTGWGDLDADHQNAYITFEARHQDSIRLKDRPYLAVTDWTPWGGANLTQGTQSGAASGASSGAGSGSGYLTDTSGNPIYYYPGCTAAAAAADQCGYANPNITIQPETSNLDLLGRYTRDLGNGWQANVQASLLNSQAKEVGNYNNAFATGVGSGANGGGVNLFKFGPNIGPTPAFPDQFPFVITVPSNYPGNSTGAAAPLVYDFPDLGPQTQKVTSNSTRLVAELGGTLGGWDLNAAAGYTRVSTKIELFNYIDFPNLQAALDSGSYIVGGSNSASVLAGIAPAASSTSTNELSFLSLRGSHDLVKLPGGMMQLGAGAELTRRSLHEAFPTSFINGQQASGIYSFAVGKQTVGAAYVELDAPIVKSLEIDAAARVDHYDTYGSSVTPKVGFKFAPMREFTLRGTYSQGFRAPNPAEIGNAGSTSGFVGNLQDPLYCPGGKPSANLPPGYTSDSCSISLQELQLSSKHLDPEKSKSFTLGLIVEPNSTYSGTLDYYHITIRDQIISVGQLGQGGLDNAATLGTVIYRDAGGNVLYDTYPFINANTTTTSGFDLNLRARYGLGDAGKLTAELQTSYMTQYDLTAQGVTYHLAGSHGPAFVSTDTGTPRTRAAFTLTWERGPMQLAATVNYISGFSVTDPSYGIPDCATALSAEFPTTPPPAQFCRVPSFTELNVVGRYDVSKKLQLHAGVTNLLNRRAPRDLQTFGSAGNGAQQGGAPYNPAFHQDGAVGPMLTIGGTYQF
ncbi:MAG: TonB-dependent receptor [Burkholderiales bacterium]|nr:TonB-dependent receptor [Burkholderiales bacterium]